MRTVSINKNTVGPPWKIHCPACNCDHIFVEGWAFNMDYEFPTFIPDMYVKTNINGKPRVCHGIIKDGLVTYLGDTTHEYRGTTLQLPSL